MGVTVPGGQYRLADGTLVDANGVPLREPHPQPEPVEPDAPKPTAKPTARKPKK